MRAKRQFTAEHTMITTIAVAARHLSMVALTISDTAGTHLSKALSRLKSKLMQRKKISTMIGTEAKTNSDELQHPKLEDLQKLTKSPVLKWDFSMPGHRDAIVAISGNIAFIKYCGKDAKLFKRSDKCWVAHHPVEVYGPHMEAISLSDTLSFGYDPRALDQIFNTLYAKYIEALMINDNMRQIPNE